MQTAQKTHDHPAIGSPMDGGFYAGAFTLDGQAFALIVAPKDGGEQDDTEWNDTYNTVDGAMSFNDGLANTNAMAAAGSKLAQWALGLDLDGHNDWYLPSQDELEIIYRNLKPTTETNSQWARSGINLSAIDPTRPYTKDSPTITPVAEFQAGGAEAFDDEWYWSSTQHAADSSNAWCQHFGDGLQNLDLKHDQLRARAVRRLAI